MGHTLFSSEGLGFIGHTWFRVAGVFGFFLWAWGCANCVEGLGLARVKRFPTIGMLLRVKALQPPQVTRGLELRSSQGGPLRESRHCEMLMWSLRRIEKNDVSRAFL